MHSRLGAGAVAGLAAGVVWGVLLSVMQTPMLTGGQPSMMTIIGRAVRSDSFLVAWAAHLLVGLVLGVVFAVLVGRRLRDHGDAVALGILYGLAVWVGGWMIAMPLLLGEPVLATVRDLHSLPLAVGSFLGHILYGALVGALFAALRLHRARAAAPSQDVARRAA
jgi:hypothetical protein